MIQRTTVRLPDDLLARARRKAAAEGRTLTALIEDGLRLVTDDRARVARRERVIPRVSQARGGLLPGIDLDDMSSIQAIEDVDYMEHMTLSR